jgi:H+/Cl- antiporter ClcA
MRQLRSHATALGLGLLAGLLAGASSWVFLTLLEAVTEFREDEAPWLLWLLAPGSFVIVAGVHHFGGRSTEGTPLVINAARGAEPGQIPARMAPFILFNTLASHLFAASVGREGTAVQLTGSLVETCARPFRLNQHQRRTLLIAAVAGAFGAVFGVPVAGTVFACEVAWRRRRVTDFPLVLVACAAAAFSGHRVMGALGYEHEVRLPFELGVGPWMLVRFAIAGVAFGAAAWLFHHGVILVRRLLGRISYPPLRAAIAGAVMVGATFIVGRASIGLSLPVAEAALSGGDVSPMAWLSKIGFTALCLGGGIPGGEVTPLFVSGAALGAALAKPLSLAQGALASVGFVSVFGAAARSPIASVVLAVELFGSQALLPTAVVAAAALLTRGSGGLYEPHRPHGLRSEDFGDIDDPLAS